MEKAEAESSKKSSSFCSRRKVIRRKSHTRKAPTSCLTNMAEARREIVNALHLHRSASSLLHSSNKHHFNNNPPILNTTCDSNSINDDQKYYYHQLLESMPIPEPTWSTTAPAVLCAPVPTVDVLLDEFDWLDNYNLSSSYSWWIGFLNSLDGKINGHLPLESKEGLGQCLDEDEKLDLDVGNEQSSVADEWLVFLATEECGEKLECELTT